MHYTHGLRTEFHKMLKKTCHGGQTICVHLEQDEVMSVLLITHWVVVGRRCVAMYM